MSKSKKHKRKQQQQQRVEKFRVPELEAGSMVPLTTPIKPPYTPCVYYSDSAQASIDYIVRKNPKEVGWLGTVEPLGLDFLITEVFVPKQKVHSSNTTIEGSALTDLAMQLLQDNKDPSTLLYWGHSHVNMHVNPSTQDELQIEDYLEDVDYFIRGIYNKKGDSKVDVFDLSLNLVHQRVENCRLPPQLSEEELAALDKAVEENVTIQVMKPLKPRQGARQTQTIGGVTSIVTTEELSFNDYTPSDDDEEWLTDRQQINEYLEEWFGEDDSGMAPGGPC